MAKVGMNTGFDFRNFDFTELDAYDNSTFFNNVNYQFSSPSGPYVGEDALIYYDGTNAQNTTSSFVFGGYGASYSNTQGYTGGRVTGIIALDRNLSGGIDGVYFFGFNIAATTVQAAIDSVSVADDHAILRLMLAGSDSILGSNDADYIFAHTGNDTIRASGGNDSVLGDAGNDSLDGGIGNDLMLGGTGNDTLIGSTGNDNLSGGTGNDVLSGGSGADVLKGDDGADKLTGGAGADSMFGGVDFFADVFVLTTAAESGVGAAADKIYNFSHTFDSINLKTVDGNSAVPAQQHLTYHGATAAAHAVWVIHSGADTLIRGDVNGNLVADFEIRLVNYSGTFDASDLWL